MGTFRSSWSTSHQQPSMLLLLLSCKVTVFSGHGWKMLLPCREERSNSLLWRLAGPETLQEVTALLCDDHDTATLVSTSRMLLSSSREDVCLAQPVKGSNRNGFLRTNIESGVLIETPSSPWCPMRWAPCNIFSTHAHDAAGFAKARAARFRMKRRDASGM